MRDAHLAQCRRALLQLENGRGTFISVASFWEEAKMKQWELAIELKAFGPGGVEDAEVFMGQDLLRNVDRTVSVRIADRVFRASVERFEVGVTGPDNAETSIELHGRQLLGNITTDSTSELLGLLEEHLRWYEGDPSVGEEELMSKTRAFVARAKGNGNE